MPLVVLLGENRLDASEHNAIVEGNAVDVGPPLDLLHPLERQLGPGLAPAGRLSLT